MESAIVMLVIGLVAMYCAKYATEPARGVINVVGIILAVVGAVRLLFALL